MKSLRIILFLAALSALSDAAGETVCDLNTSIYAIRYNPIEENGITYSSNNTAYSVMEKLAEGEETGTNMAIFDFQWITLLEGMPGNAIKEVNSSICKLMEVQEPDGTMEPRQTEWDGIRPDNADSGYYYHFVAAALTVTDDYIAVRVNEEEKPFGFKSTLISSIHSFDGQTGKKIDWHTFLDPNAWQDGSEFKARLWQTFSVETLEDVDVKSCAKSSSHTEIMPIDIYLSAEGVHFGFFSPFASKEEIPGLQGSGCDEFEIEWKFDQFEPFVAENFLKDYRRYVKALKKLR